MAEKKTKATPPSTVAGGEPTGAWARIRAEAVAKGKFVGPFQITDELVLSPPTPERARAMGRYTSAAQATVAALINAVQNGAPAQEVTEIRDRLDEADAGYTRALIGPQYDAVVAYFADKEQDELKVFLEAVKHQFLREPTEEELSRIEQLEERVNTLCGIVLKLDPDNQVVADILGERPGKEPGSSTTSNATGTNSNPTSPDTSVPGQGTGSTTTPDLGASSSTTPKLALA